jgi:alkyl hydroperoxide reductase subunit F
MYDLAIIGGGPAGVSAGVYASRKKLKTVLITDDFGGQSIVSDSIENWIGTPKISGIDLAKSLENHLRTYANDIVDIKLGEKVSKVSGSNLNFEITTEGGGVLKAKTVLVAVGSTRRKLTVPGADRLENRGIVYCASCDGPLYSGADVVVIGGGNAGFETAAQLAAYCKSVTILQRSPDFRADPITVEKVLAKPNVKGITNTEIVEVKGEKSVTSLVYKDLSKGELIDLQVTGVFVEIGLVPATNMVKDLVKLNQYGQIEIDPWKQTTSIEGVWAAGDCTNVLYHQNNIASGDAVRALEDIYLHIHTK